MFSIVVYDRRVRFWILRGIRMETAMLKIRLKCLLTTTLVFFLFAASCARIKVYSSSPPVRTISNSYFEMRFEPQKGWGKPYFNSFRIVLINRTDKDLIIDWSKTYYLLGGRKNGQFGWEGMTFEELKGIRSQPDVALRAGNTFSQVIFPLKLIAWDIKGKHVAGDRSPEDAFYPGLVPQGESGISLAVRLDGKMLIEETSVTIRTETVNR